MLIDLSSPSSQAIFLVSLIIAMVIHEVMHGYVAFWLGDTTAQDAGRLTLNPLKHIDLLTTIILPLVLILAHYPPLLIAKPVPFNPDRLKYEEFGAALVGFAGPASNFILAAITGVVFRFFSSGMSLLELKALYIFAFVNIALFIFNLIPIPPLDGSRVLYAFAPEPIQEFMQRIEAFGFLAVLAFVFILFQFFSNTFSQIENTILQFLLG